MGSQSVEQSDARGAQKTQEKRGNVQSSVPQSSSHKRGIVLRLTSQFLGERPQFQRTLSRYILTKYRGIFTLKSAIIFTAAYCPNSPHRFPQLPFERIRRRTDFHLSLFHKRRLSKGFCPRNLSPLFVGP
jgi:hypothetical protein